MSNSIVLGGGCFWCMEAVFKRVKGVRHVLSGYCGGSVAFPDYKSVCTGRTGHAEVIKIEYNSDIIGLDKLLDIFFHIHDPTSLNQQGGDVGTQYRSVAYYANEDEKNEIGLAIERIASQASKPVVTEVSTLPEFYPAEEYHHDYFARNPTQGYCMAVVDPKVRKFLKEFPEEVA